MEKLETKNGKFYVVKVRVYSPSGEWIKEEFAYTSAEMPEDLEYYSKYNELHDCEVTVYEIDIVEQNVQEITSEFFRLPSDCGYIPVTILVEYIPYGNWKFKLKFPDREETINVTREDIYLRYKSGAYSDSEFVNLFFSHLI